MRKPLLLIALSLLLASCQSLFTPTLKVGILPEHYVDSSTAVDHSYNTVLASNFAKSQKMKMKFIPLSQEELLKGLRKGSIDIVISSIIKIDLLPEDLSYTLAYQENDSLAFILRQNSPSLKRPKAGFFLDKKSISWGVLAQAHNKNFAKKQISNDLKVYQTLEEGFKALRRREITILIADYPMIKHHTKSNPFSDIATFKWTAKKEELVAICHKASPHLEAFNTFISKQK